MLQVKNEYGTLKTVLMASVDTFKLHPPINSTQEYYYKNDPPILAKLVSEQQSFVDVLKQRNVQVVWADRREDCTNQINTRDVAFVVGDIFVVSPMRKKERMNEHYALETIISTFSDEDKVLRPKECFIEGGDIILANDTLFVGISQRTNVAGVSWLINTFSDKFVVTPIYLEKDFLHLDCVFNLLSKNDALVLKSGIKEESIKEIQSRFNVLFVEEAEQKNLPTNVFSIDEHTVVADCRNKKTNSIIRAAGKDVIELDFTEISKIGGSFRCSTCPLRRE